MKVAIVSQGKPTPQHPLNGLFEFDQAKALARAGVEVAYVAIDFRAWSHKRKFGLFRYESDGVKVFELSMPLGVYRRAIPVLQRLLLIPFRAMLKTFGKPDIVHAHFYSIAAIASILKKRYGIPFVVTEHSSKLNKPAAQISDLDKRLATQAYRSCDQLICVSEALQHNLMQNFGRESLVIPNMVDNQSFTYHDTKKNDKPFVFVGVGNLKPIKAFDVLVEAFAQLPDDTRLLIIGDGPEREKLQSLIEKHQLGSRVELKGRLNRTEINQIFQNSHAFVLPSQSETFGVSYIEAMYAGLPVIATRCGGPESFVDSDNGLLVPVGDTAALVEAMQSMRLHYDSYDLRQISSRCIEKFSPEVVSRNIIAVYEKMLIFVGETTL